MWQECLRRSVLCTEAWPSIGQYLASAWQECIAHEDFMDWDDVVPKAKPTVAIGEALAALSLSELEARIAALEGEIERVRVEIAKKQSHEAAAAALFKR